MKGRKPLSPLAESPYKLPSWCPDFGSDDQSYCARFYYERAKDPEKYNYIPWTPRCSELPQAGQDLTRLRLLGLTLDDITMVTESTRSWTPDETIAHCFQRVLDQLAKRTSSATKYLNGDTMTESSWMPICGTGPCDERQLASGASHNLTCGNRRLKNSHHQLRENSQELLGLAKPMGDGLVHKNSFDGRDDAVAKTAEDHLEVHVLDTMRWSNFCSTEKGYMALVPDVTQAGDVICALHRECTSFVLRSVQEENPTHSMVLVGPADVHGFMDGLPLRWRDEGHLEEREYVLV